MHLGRTGFAQHPDELLLCGAPYHRVVHHESRLPSMFSLSGLSFMRTACARISWLGAMNVRPM